MKDKSVIIRIIHMLFICLTIYFISNINNIFATIIITFFLTNTLIIIIEILESQLLHKESKLLIAINEVKKMNDKSEKTVNIITLLYPSIFTTLLAFIIHLVYVFIR